MPIDVDRFVQARPRLFHLTARTNVAAILGDLLLRPASELFALAGELGRLRERRQSECVLQVDGRSIHVRDQAPLHRGHMALAMGWTFEDFVAHLNEHVFFWPGTVAGLGPYGRRYAARYASEDNVLLMVDTATLLKANATQAVRFCRYNSGSPRCNRGCPSPRGPNSFQTASEYDGVPSSVVEVTFRGPVALPPDSLQVVDPAMFVQGLAGMR